MRFFIQFVIVLFFSLNFLSAPAAADWQDFVIFDFDGKKISVKDPLGKEIYESYPVKSLRRHAQRCSDFKRLENRACPESIQKKLGEDLINAVNNFKLMREITTVEFDGKLYDWVNGDKNFLFLSERCAQSLFSQGLTTYEGNERRCMRMPRREELVQRLQAVKESKIAEEKRKIAEEKRKAEEKRRAEETKIAKLRQLNVLGEIIHLNKIENKNKESLEKLTETCVRVDQTACPEVEVLKKKIVEEIIAARIAEEKRIAEERRKAEEERKIAAKIDALMRFELDGKGYKLNAEMAEVSFTEIAFLAKSCAEGNHEKCGQFETLKKKSIAAGVNKIRENEARIAEEKRIAEKKRKAAEKKRKATEKAVAKKKAAEEKIAKVVRVLHGYYIGDIIFGKCVGSEVMSKSDQTDYRKRVNKVVEMVFNDPEYKVPPPNQDKVKDLIFDFAQNMYHTHSDYMAYVMLEMTSNFGHPISNFQHKVTLRELCNNTKAAMDTTLNSVIMMGEKGKKKKRDF